MLSGSDLQALKAVQEQGGETVAHTVSRIMRIDPNYARLILNSLARADYVDLVRSGKYRITFKGRSELEKKGIVR
ncbi:MAG: hypothetical protein ACE5I8_02725 [Thermodesulfobacteriota bacterium]